MSAEPGRSRDLDRRVAPGDAPDAALGSGPGAGAGDDPVADCERAADAVAWLQGELTPEQTADFVGHLDDCATCRRVARESREVLTIMESLELRRRAGPATLRQHLIQVALRPRNIAAALMLAAVFVVVAEQAGLGRGATDDAAAPPRGERATPMAVAPGAASGAADAALVRASTSPRETSPSLGAGAATWAESLGASPADECLTRALGLLALASAADEPAAVARVRAEAAWLVEHQDADGGLGRPLVGGHFDHAVATLALLEASRVAPDVAIRQAARRAASHLADRTRAGDRGRDGGRAAWMAAALQRAEQLGWLRDPDVRPAHDALASRGAPDLDGPAFWPRALGSSDPAAGEQVGEGLALARWALNDPTGN